MSDPSGLRVIEALAPGVSRYWMEIDRCSIKSAFDTSLPFAETPVIREWNAAVDRREKRADELMRRLFWEG